MDMSLNSGIQNQQKCQRYTMITWGLGAAPILGNAHILEEDMTEQDAQQELSKILRKMEMATEIMTIMWLWQ